jgi:hypothetical protein
VSYARKGGGALGYSSKVNLFKAQEVQPKYTGTRGMLEMKVLSE